MTAREKGRKAFMEGKPENSCSCTNKQEQREWLIGYYEEELTHLQDEQARQLQSLDNYGVPFTGLEETIEGIHSTLKQLRSGARVIII